MSILDTHSPYGDTGKFSDIIHKLKWIYHNSETPKEHRLYRFIGTIKLHGTNMSFSSYIDENGEYIITSQSRNNIIIAGPNIKDNYGFAHYLKDYNEIYKQLIILLGEKYSLDLQHNKIIIYGEWCGKGIQTKVALAQMPRQFVMFAICVINIETNIESWLNINKVHTIEGRCLFSHFVNSQLPEGSPLFYNIFDFKKYEIVIDTSKIIDDNYIDGLNTQFTELVNEVEKQCPFANAFGINGIGEGIVFEHIENGYRKIFKCKGTEHAGVKRIPKQKSQNEDLESNYKALLENWITLRFEQACEQVYTIENIEQNKVHGTRERPSFKDGKLLISWLHNDIIKEEIKEYSEAVVKYKITSTQILESGKLSSKLLTPLIIAKCAENLTI